ncbi:unnamed protein product [Rotaria sordida]|uniref:Sodefrin-like factor n=1 Tax=Rotaria sordida TaxID=392033 RepID=A0A813Q710_9BILA|nr:unnamed protein product [Rotaria sordida]CAF3530157.1 unnamed protein product [Rotaria sordida]
MFYFLLSGAILLTINADVNITCYECNGCTSTPTEISIDNDLCFRIQMNCLSMGIHVTDLTGDQSHSNHSPSNCDQTLSYSSACTVSYYCCSTDKCNTYEKPLLLSSSSSSSLLFRINKIVFSFYIIYHFKYYNKSI